MTRLHLNPTSAELWPPRLPSASPTAHAQAIGAVATIHMTGIASASDKKPAPAAPRPAVAPKPRRRPARKPEPKPNPWLRPSFSPAPLAVPLVLLAWSERRARPRIHRHGE